MCKFKRGNPGYVEGPRKLRDGHGEEIQTGKCCTFTIKRRREALMADVVTDLGREAEKEKETDLGDLRD